MSAKGLCPVMIPITVRSKFLGRFSNSLDLTLLLCSRNIFVCLQVFISSQLTSVQVSVIPMFLGDIGREAGTFAQRRLHMAMCQSDFCSAVLRGVIII